MFVTIGRDSCDMAIQEFFVDLPVPGIWLSGVMSGVVCGVMVGYSPLGVGIKQPLPAPARDRAPYRVPPYPV